MARQNKTLSARRQDATNDSLLIRSAESLGRVIGSLQRQLDAARHLTGRVDGEEFRANGHRPVKQREVGVEAKTQRKTKSTSARAASDRKSKRAAKSALKKTTAGRRRSGAKQRAAKTGRGT
jgi:hypothetical protein